MSLISQKQTLELLSNPTCVQVIRMLQVRGGRIKVSKLAEILAEPTQTLEGDEKARRRITHLLLRTHIPKMERLGIVQFDAVSKTVSLKELPTPLATELESMMLLLFELLRTKQ